MPEFPRPEHSVVIDASPEAVLEAILDPAAYGHHTKVGRVEAVNPGRPLPGRDCYRIIHGNFKGREGKILARFYVEPLRVILVQERGFPRAFHAEFRLEPLDGGQRTRLTHVENYSFGLSRFAPLLNRLIDAWAVESVIAEVESIKEFAESKRSAAAVATPV